MRLQQILAALPLGAACVLWPAPTPPTALPTLTVGDPREQAFGVLEARCNVCHRSANPAMVFTFENMDAMVPRIHRQVFVWRRMPKGRANRLTGEEKAVLRQWLDLQRGR